MPAKKVMIAMSGGVDSSLSAYLLKQQGYDVVGATMCLGITAMASKKTLCCSKDAIGDARNVCDRLEIPHYVFDYVDEMHKNVVDNFVDAYEHGRTPNPCVECNRHLKFDLLLNKARVLGFDYLATGHYAQLIDEAGTIRMCRPADREKDQTYFLYCLRKEVLNSVLFPLGGHTKEEVRLLADSINLPVAQKPESQDICFVADGNYKEFIRSRGIAGKSGKIKDLGGNVLGEHEGITNYTVGQRKGLGVAAGRPLYVVEIDAQRDTVIVGDERDLFARGLIARKVNMLYDTIPQNVGCVIRYSNLPVRCRAAFDGESLEVTFDEPLKAVAPGQSVVLYHGDNVVGGGIIEQAILSEK
ncbi:MAG: tRNA 2-thiouridine(34) synthase MnmA [Chitinivibrionales bacterium]|nr:tRNA 2-thiouridine(34) synthase MnmA [Chitinivibrionales bacterium]